jgi:hypothetical protein
VTIDTASHSVAGTAAAALRRLLLDAAQNG